MTAPKVPLTDEEQRGRIRTDLDTSMLVEAAAGTGKTTMLLERMVELIRTGRCRVANIAAITFTRKAAAELRSRFQLELERTLAAEGEEKELLEDALEHVMVDFSNGKYDVLVCSTIIESGLDIPNVNTIVVNRADLFGLVRRRRRRLTPIRTPP